MGLVGLCRFNSRQSCRWQSYSGINIFSVEPTWEPSYFKSSTTAISYPFITNLIKLINQSILVDSAAFARSFWCWDAVQLCVGCLFIRRVVFGLFSLGILVELHRSQKPVRLIFVIADVLLADLLLILGVLTYPKSSYDCHGVWSITSMKLYQDH